MQRRSVEKGQQNARRLVARNLPEILEYESARNTVVSDIAGLSKDSVNKLSAVFLDIEDGLDDGCSRQLIINSLVALEAINEDKTRRFLMDSGYETEVRPLCGANGIDEDDGEQLHAEGVPAAGQRHREGV
ncbi:MAG: hypothetical protein P4M11_08705 [Candidatus Pacebacteria bacterium]|nr:hypothetical protein [Candidatus Paceibacterota bacterium]